MSTYVMSDLHGNYDAYKTMLKKIKFSDDDVLYILGDIIDRGPHPIKIIKDILERANVIVLAGNHCAMALECLDFLMQEITEETIEDLDELMVGKLFNWMENGAKTTIDEFRQCDKATKQDVIDFISDLELYEELKVNGREFIMVHAGLGGFEKNKPMWEYRLENLIWERPDYTVPYFEAKYVITGHTPTVFIEENDKPCYIYKANNHIAIDCGCSFPGGRLACIRLDDLKEFYVEEDEY